MAISRAIKKAGYEVVNRQNLIKINEHIFDTIYLERKYELYKQYCRSYKKLYELLESKIGEGCDANTEQTIDISQGSIAA